MKFLSKIACAVVTACAFLTVSPALAGTTKMPSCLQYPSVNGGSVPCEGVVAVDANTGNPISWQTLFSAIGTTGALPATSTPITWNTTTTQTFGPWVPQLGRDIWAAFSATGGTFSAVVSTTMTTSCADALPLTAASGTYNLGTFVNSANEDIGMETRSSAKYCVTITPGTGASISGGLYQ